MPRKSTVKLNKRVVEALAVERGDRVFYDRELTGFGVRVHATGRKVYVVHARAPGGTLKRASIYRKIKNRFLMVAMFRQEGKFPELSSRGRPFESLLCL